jgi:hypothetical protein
MNTEKKIKQDWREGAYKTLRAPDLSQSEFNTTLNEIIGIHIDAVLEIKELENECKTTGGAK